MISKLSMLQPRRGRMILSLALAACASFGAQAETETDNVLAAIKFPPVKVFSDKLMGVARQVMPGQEVEMYPMLFLGAFGYPNFAGVSESDPVTVFVFDSDIEGEMPFVIMAKLEEDSQLRAALTAPAGGGNPMALGMTAEDRDGWTLLTQDPVNFKYVKDVSALASLSSEIEDFDITARLYIGPEKMSEWVKELKTKVRDEHVLAGGAEDDEALGLKERYVDFIATIGENLEFYDFGIDVNNSAVGLGLALQAIEGTPEYTMLSAKAGGDVPVAEFISAAAPLIYASNVDIESIEAYYNVLNDRAMKIATEKGQALLKKAAEVNEEYFKLIRNGMAGSTEFSGDEPVSASVTNAKLTNEQAVEIAKVYYEELIPEVMDHMTSLEVAESDTAKFKLNPNVGEVDGLPINEVVSSIKTMDMPGAVDEEPAETIESQTNFFTIVDGKLVSGSSQEKVFDLAKVVAAGKPVDNSVASRIKLKEGQAMAFQLNFQPLVEMFMADMPFQSQSAKQAYKSLQSEDLAPATGAIHLAKGKALGNLSVPVSSIVKLSEAQRKIEQAELEAQTFGPEPTEPVETEN